MNDRERAAYYVGSLHPVDDDDWFGTEDHQAYEDMYAAAAEGSRDDYQEPPTGIRAEGRPFG